MSSQSHKAHRAAPIAMRIAVRFCLCIKYRAVYTNIGSVHLYHAWNHGLLSHEQKGLEIRHRLLNASYLYPSSDHGSSLSCSSQLCSSESATSTQPSAQPSFPVHLTLPQLQPAKPFRGNSFSWWLHIMRERIKGDTRMPHRVCYLSLRSGRVQTQTLASAGEAKTATEHGLTTMSNK